MSLRRTIEKSGELGIEILAEFDKKYIPAKVAGDICQKCGSYIGRYSVHETWHEDISLANFIMLRWIESHNASFVSQTDHFMVTVFGLGREPR